MLNGGDVDLNSVYTCTNPLKQGLKQTMLNQELPLMSQINKLHQPYRIQTEMMKHCSWKMFDDNNSPKEGIQFIPENKSCLAQPGSFGFQHEPVGLQLSADEFISHYADDSMEEPPTVSSKNFMDPKNFSRGITVSDVDNINLSLDLSIGQSKTNDCKRSERNKSCASFSEVIDLEDPTFGLLKNNTGHELPARFAAAKSVSKDKNKLDSFLQIGMNHIPYQSPARESVLGVGPSCQRPTVSYAGHVGHYREFLSADLFSKNPTSGTCKPKNLDLNVDQFEYSSCLSNNFSMVQNPLKVARTHAMTSPSTSWNKANVIDLSDSSDRHQLLDLNISLTNTCGQNNEGGWNKVDKFRTFDSGEICVIDLDSDSEEPCSSNKSNPKIESVDSSPNFLSNLTCKTECVDAEPHVQNQVADHVYDDGSNDLKTIQSVVKCEDLNVCSFDECQKKTLSPLTDNSGEHDQKSSDNTESNIQYINNKKLEEDEMVSKAAESLVKISSESQVCLQNGVANELPDKDNDQPQCSSLDSYEKMVLCPKESDPNDFCVSSSPFAVEESENTASRYKLKRGTRLKDFQKDILPSLSSLSRREINEDINIMEGVIRSREYRKMKGKVIDDGVSFRAGRSKRSRAGFNRRYYE